MAGFSGYLQANEAEMEISMKKKSIMIWIMACAFASALMGCGGKADTAPESSGEGEAEEFVYVAEYEELGEEGYGVGSVIIGEDGTVFYTIANEDETRLAVRKTDGEEEQIPVDLEENTAVNAIGKDTEGNLLLGLVQSSGNGAESTVEKVSIRKIKPDGTVIQEIDTGKALLKEPDFYIQSLLEDKEGNYYICYGKGIYVLKPDGEPYFKADAGTYISNMFSIKGEKVVAAYYGDIGWELQEVDMAGKGLKPMDSQVAFDYGTYQGGGNRADILYTEGTKLYTYNMGEEKPTEILNWVDSDIDSTSLQDFAILEDGKVVAVSMDINAEISKGEMAVLTRKNRSEVPEKIVLTYGTLYVPYFVKTDVVAFNKQSEKYRIEIKEYGEGDKDYETMMNLWSADLSSGNGPDIIDMYYCPVGLKELVDMGVVEDLYPYLDKDEELNRDDYIENAMKAYELDGKLYAIMRCFGISTVIGKVSDVGEGSTWTLDDVFALMDAKGSNAELFEYTTKYNALQMMMQTNEDLFVDEESGECNFEDEEFIKILEFANRFPKEVEYDPNAPGAMEKIRNGELLLIKDSVTSVQQYQLYEYQFGEPVNLIGYPTTKESGTMIEPNGTKAAMNVNSENKEGVWEFFRFLLEKERQENLQSANGGFPVMRSALEKQFEKDMQAEYYEDVDGEKKEKPKGWWSAGKNGEVTVEVYAASKEQTDKVREMIETAQKHHVDSKMLEIIMEEAQSYFDGQKSVQEAASLIQSRMQIYINEKR